MTADVVKEVFLLHFKTLILVTMKRIVTDVKLFSIFTKKYTIVSIRYSDIWEKEKFFLKGITVALLLRLMDLDNRICFASQHSFGLVRNVNNRIL